MKRILRQSNMNRRTFLGSAALGATAITIVPRHVLGGPGFVPPSERVNIGIVGAGGQGRTNARALFQENDARIVAVCDPNERSDYDRFYYKGVAGRGPVKQEIEKRYAGAGKDSTGCAEYLDFREMLEKEKGLDAILCATPDHAHAVVTMAAIQSGKHVYCEKPLTHNVREARQIARAARQAGVATQMGNHGHSGEGIRMTCEFIWDGAIGPVREVHGWSDAGRWVEGSGRPADSPPVPVGLDWDLWLGPRKPRPYHPLYTPYNWRGWWEFGTGAIGDMACHNLDPAVWALDLKDPISVEASAPAVDSERVSHCAIFRYKFGPRGDMPPVEVTWYDGGLRPARPDELEEGRRVGGGGNGVLFIGDRGTIMCEGWGGTPIIIPESRRKEYKRPAKSLPRSKGHHRDWLDACKGGPKASAEFEYSARLTELVLLGNVALRTGKKLAWDGPNMRATNAPEADEFIREEYRPGWNLV